MAKLLGGTTIAGDLLVSGNVYAATPLSGDNSTRTATTAFVRSGYVQLAQTGAFYGSNNPSGYVRSVETGAFYGSNNPSGYVRSVETGIFYTSNNPSGYIRSTQTGAFYGSNNPSGYIRSTQTGAFYGSNNPSGFITGVNLAPYVLKSETGSFVNSDGSVITVISLTQSQFNLITSPSDNTLYVITGDAIIPNVDLNSYITVGQTGAFYATSNPSGYIRSTQTGAFYGSNNPSGYIRSTQTGAFYGSNNPSGYVRSVETGAFYGSNNPSGYVRSVETGAFYGSNNPSGYITGVNLQSYQLKSESISFNLNTTTNGSGSVVIDYPYFSLENGARVLLNAKWREIDVCGADGTTGKAMILMTESYPSYLTGSSASITGFI